MIMSPVELGTKNGCAGEARQEFIRLAPFWVSPTSLLGYKARNGDRLDKSKGWEINTGERREENRRKEELFWREGEGGKKGESYGESAEKLKGWKSNYVDMTEREKYTSWIK
jgi:hypothetical protein